MTQFYEILGCIAFSLTLTRFKHFEKKFNKES